jgi:nucleotide-binding universal stress UspA family protein
VKKILVAVDDKKDTAGVVALFQNMVSTPDNLVLVHVQQLEGNAMMTAMLGDAEMATLKESLKGTEHKAKLDQKSEKVLAYYKEEFEKGGLTNIKTVVKEGHPSEEILKVAEEEKVDLIIVGCGGKTRLQRLVTGCASRDVEKNAKVPVMIAKGNGCGEHAHSWSGREEAYAIR